MISKKGISSENHVGLYVTPGKVAFLFIYQSFLISIYSNFC